MGLTLWRRLIHLWTSRVVLWVVLVVSTVLLLLLPTGLERELHPPGVPVVTGWSGAAYGQGISDFLNGVAARDLPYVQDDGRVINFFPYLANSWWNSFRLFAAVVGIALPLGLVLGALFVARARWLRAAGSVLPILGQALPDFFLVMLAHTIAIWAYRVYGVRLWPVLAEPGVERGWLVPMIALVAFPAGYLARLTAASLDEVIHSDYIRTARAKGLPEWRVIGRHALASAWPRILSGLPTALNMTLSGLVVVERLTVWPGLARWLVPQESFLIDSGGFQITGIGPPIVALTGALFITWFVLVDALTRSIAIVGLKGGSALS